MGGCSPNHGGRTNREVDILAHAGYYMLQGGLTVGSGTQDYTELCHSVWCYVEGCSLMHTDTTLGHIIQWCVGLWSEE